MKTTIELPDDLLTKAKATAAMRRTTLKAMIEHALKRELDFPDEKVRENEIYEINEHGFPVLKKKENQRKISSEDVYKIMEEVGPHAQLQKTE
jgi:transcription termination factor Rho